MADAKIKLTAEDKTRAAFESVKSGLAQVGSMAQFAGVSLASLGAAATLGGLAAMVNRIASGIDAMNDLKDATGASIENISALENIALSTGGNFDTVSTSLIKFNMALGQTVKPGSDAERVIKAIGLNAKELREMDPAQALLKTAVALNRFADDGTKAREMQELFGKSLKEVAPYLKDLAERGQLVATMTTKQAEEVEKYRKELFKLNAAATDLGRDLAGPVMTGMNGLIEKFREGKKEGDGFVVTLLKQTQLYSEWKNLFGSNPIAAASIAAPASLNRQVLGGGGYDQIKPGMKLGPTKEQIDATNKQLAQQAKLLAELSGLSGSFAEDWAQLNTLFKAGRINLVQLTAAQAALLAKQPAFVKNQKDIEESSKALEERWKDEKKVIDELYESRQRVFDQAEKASTSAQEMLAEIQFEAALIGKTNEERTVAIALRQLEKTGIDQTTIAYQGLRSEIEQQVRSNMQAQAGIDAAKKVKDEWESANQQIASSFVDNLMRGGKSVAQYLKDLFRTLVLRPLLQPVGNMMAGAVNGVMGGAMGGNGMMGGMGGLGTLGSMAEGTGILGAVGSSLGVATGSSAGIAAGVGGWGGYGAVLASEAGVGGTLSSLAGGATSVLSAIPVVGWIALAAMAAYAMFGGKGGGPKNIGSFGTGDLAGDFTRADSNAQANTGAQQAAMGILDSYKGIAASLGIAAASLQVGVMTSIDDQGDGDALTALVTQAYIDGQAVYDRENSLSGSDAYKNVGRSQEELAAALREASADAVLSALRATDMPEQMAAMFAALDPLKMTATEIEAAITRITGITQQRQQLEATLFDLTATDLEKLNKVRAAERAAVDASNLVLLEQIYVQQDLATAAEAAAETMRINIPDSILRLSRGATSLSEAARSVGAQFAAAAAQVAQNTMQDAVDQARQNLQTVNEKMAETYRRESEQLSVVTERFASMARSLRELRESLDGGPQGGLFGSMRYNAAKQALRGATAETAPELVRRFLDAAQDSAATSLDYRRDVAQAKGVLLSLESGANLQIATARTNYEAAQIARSTTDGLATLAASAKLQIAEYNQSTYGADQATRGTLLEPIIQSIYSQSGLSQADFERWAWEQLNMSVTLPSYAVGTSYVPRDMIANVHRGERITPAAYNRSDADNAAIVAELRILNARLESVEAASRKTADVLQRVTRDGNSLLTVAA